MTDLAESRMERVEIIDVGMMGALVWLIACQSTWECVFLFTLHYPIYLMSGRGPR